MGDRGDGDGRKLTIAMVDGAWRIYYGDEAGGRYVNISDYDEIRDYVLSRLPRAELIERYGLGDDRP